MCASERRRSRGEKLRVQSPSPPIACELSTPRRTWSSDMSMSASMALHRPGLLGVALAACVFGWCVNTCEFGVCSWCAGGASPCGGVCAEGCECEAAAAITVCRQDGAHRSRAVGRRHKQAGRAPSALKGLSHAHPTHHAGGPRHGRGAWHAGTRDGRAQAAGCSCGAGLRG